MPDLSAMRGWIIDLDGVLWRGESPLPGAADFLDRLRGRGARFVLATNNATASPASVIRHLRRFGARARSEEVLTSAIAAAAYLEGVLPAQAPVYAIGEAPLRAALAQRGFRLLDRADGAQAVVVGLDRRVNWRKLLEATLALRAGALFIGTNPDPTFPHERGQVPGNGALLAALRAASGREPTIVGKPESPLFRSALDLLGTRPEDTVVVGDRLDTDILGGQRAGLHTALVLTGVTRREALPGVSPSPDWVFDGLPDLLRQLGPGEAP
ncbi:MAG TPA: HAD-IIA family hydrolase [Anaerolineales bacterium]